MGAQWTAAGFVHGVLNTDNINVTGESFDYGPWRFLPTYDPRFTAAYFDQSGLYAFGRQPTILQWNLTRLAECLTLVAEEEAVVEALRAYAPAFEDAIRTEVLRRLGLVPEGAEEDDEFLKRMFRFLAESQVGYERFFFDWRGGTESRARAEASPEAAKYAGEAFAALAEAMAGYRPVADTRLWHPYFAGEPCTMLIDEVERIWAPIAAEDDWSLFGAKLRSIDAMAEAYGVR
jgi:uncharacterized protein YdiU (UPF0061 family)